MDYSATRDGSWNGPRYGVVLHLLSIAHNWRVRVRSVVADDEFPLIASVTSVWTSASWYERARRSTCTASSSKAIRTCAAS